VSLFFVQHTTACSVAFSSAIVALVLIVAVHVTFIRGPLSILVANSITFSGSLATDAANAYMLAVLCLDRL
jgi:hypothetical protein